MATINFYPHNFGRNYWDVWDYPQKVSNQHFANDVRDLDHLYTGSLKVKPESQPTENLSGISHVTNEKDKFEIQMEVCHFHPNEITVNSNHCQDENTLKNFWSPLA